MADLQIILFLLSVIIVLIIIITFYPTVRDIFTKPCKYFPFSPGCIKIKDAAEKLKDVGEKVEKKLGIGVKNVGETCILSDNCKNNNMLKFGQKGNVVCVNGKCCAQTEKCGKAYYCKNNKIGLDLCKAVQIKDDKLGIKAKNIGESCILSTDCKGSNILKIGKKGNVVCFNGKCCAQTEKCGNTYYCKNDKVGLDTCKGFNKKIGHSCSLHVECKGYNPLLTGSKNSIACQNNKCCKSTEKCESGIYMCPGTCPVKKVKKEIEKGLGEGEKVIKKGKEVVDDVIGWFGASPK